MDLFRTIAFLPVVVLLACQGKPGEQPAQTAAGPSLQKIAIHDRAEADSLLKAGFDLLVIEDTYVVARVEPAEHTKIASMNLKATRAEESDLIQRLVKIPLDETHGVQPLVDLGMDVWQVKQDTVIAQAYDKYIREATEKGYQVLVVAKNVQEVAAKKN
ncbi:MAG: hypothetical protein D6743_01320 [Calditrichaeota bacterium]|nr:MAG: hypothetical protein D6743_01320 [Calditrichota bacterium]